MESNSIPLKDMLVEGPQVLSGAMRIPGKSKATKTNPASVDRVAL